MVVQEELPQILQIKAANRAPKVPCVICKPLRLERLLKHKLIKTIRKPISSIVNGNSKKKYYK